MTEESKELTGHWTQSDENFTAAIRLDFFRQFHDLCPNLTPTDFADLCGVSRSRVSQVMSGAGHEITLLTAVRFARAAGKKVALVLYDDSDNTNEYGPILPQIFVECWNRCGQPRDFFDLEEATSADAVGQRSENPT